MSEEAKQQNICSAVFSLSCINLEDGRRDNKKFHNTPEQKIFFVKVSQVLQRYLKLQSYLFYLGKESHHNLECCQRHHTNQSIFLLWMHIASSVPTFKVRPRSNLS